MSDAFRAWKIATRALWWAFVLWIMNAATLQAKASRENLVLHPRTPRDLWNNGYVIFVYQIAIDAFEGSYRQPEDKAKYLLPTILWDTRGAFWRDIPWHEVDYSDPDCSNIKGHRAVPKDYADKHLRIGQRMAA